MNESFLKGQKTKRLRLYLINPVNELVSITNTKDNFWNQFRIWKPLGLFVLSGRTPPEWDVKIIDENLGIPDYSTLPPPDLVGLSAFTSQANVAYDLAAKFRKRGIPVVMGGIHATMRPDEAMQRVDSVVTGEADDIWEQVLEDAKHGCLKEIYHGTLADMSRVRPARHELSQKGYIFGSIQVSRGCPLNCSFCSVTQFNGKHLRRRPIENVIAELKMIRERFFLVADDNLIGTKRDQMEYAKELFRAMIKAKINKKWMGQVTINFADDSELMTLAAKAGCFGMLIGFESPTAEGLKEVNKKFNTGQGRNLRDSVKRIQKHRIMVVGSFAMGLDVDQKGIGRQIADTGHFYGVDIINAMMLTPLPGTQLFAKLDQEKRIIANNFPNDWKYYTLTYPVSKFNNFGWNVAVQEMCDVNRYFYSFPRIVHRLTGTFWRSRKLTNLIVGLATNLSYRFNRSIEHKSYEKFSQRAPAIRSGDWQQN